MSSITSPPAKIYLASTTKISLNDRFAKLAKAKVQQEVAQPPAVVSHQQQIKPVVRVRNPEASSKNKQLALSLAARPSVRAALQIKNKSIRQQQHALASTRQQNTSLINQNTAAQLLLLQQQQQQLELQIQQQQAQMRGFDPSRLSVNGRLYKPSLANRLTPRNSAGSVRGGKQFRQGPQVPQADNFNQRLRRVGANGNGVYRGASVYVRGGGGIRRGGRGGGLNTSGRVEKRTSVGKPMRGAPAGRGRGAARGGRGSANGVKKQPPKSKENLDMDLDQYMSKSKSHLDADLDTYMSQAQQQAATASAVTSQAAQ